MSATAGMSAHAQNGFDDAFSPQIWIGFEGGIQQLQGNHVDAGDSNEGFYYEAPNYGDTLGSFLGSLMDREFTGAFEFGVRPVDSQYDFVGRFRFSHGSGAESEFGSYFEQIDPFEFVSESYAFERDVEESLMAADFEVGRDVGIGHHEDAESRVHFGFRSAFFNGTAVVDFAEGFAYAEASGPDGRRFEHDVVISERLESSFVGFGPRLGVETAIPLHNSGFSLDVGVAGAVLYGRRKVEVQGDYDHTDVYTYFEFDEELEVEFPVTNAFQYGSTMEDWAFVYNAEANVGLSYAFGTMATVSAGYRVAAYWNLVDTAYNDDGAGERIEHGPYAKMIVNLK